MGKDTVVKDWRGWVLGYLSPSSNGDVVAYDFYRRKVGSYRAATDTTVDFYGRMVSRGDTTMALIRSAADEDDRRRGRKR